MNCKQAAEQLDDYLDGYLANADRLALENHTRACAACRASLQELEDLLRQAKKRSAGISPERDLWPSILEQIEATEPQRPANTTRYWLAMAAVLAFAVIALSLLLRPSEAPSGRPVVAGPTGSLAIDAVVQAKADLARSEDRVLLTRRDLVEAIELRRDLLGPDASRSVEESLQVLDRAVAEIRLALEENPDSRRLHLALAAKYQQEVRLLQSVSRV